MAVPNLKGKQVLVTGAASGIGRSTALAFARQGADLVISDINPVLLEDTANAVRALGVQWQAGQVNDDQ